MYSCEINSSTFCALPHHNFSALVGLLITGLNLALLSQNFLNFILNKIEGFNVS